MALPRTEAEYRALIEQFESGTVPKEAWHHAEHVAVACWYLIHHDEVVAISKMRAGLLHLTAVYGIPQTPQGGYHETWTIFFMKVLKQHLDGDTRRERLAVERMQSAVERLRNFRELTRQYYSSELINSWTARTTWVEPDLRKL